MMKRYYSFKYLICLFIIHFILIWICPTHGAPRIAPKENTHTSNQQILTKMSALQVPFIANEGQVDKEVSFYARTFGGALYVTKKGEMVYSLPLIEARQDNLTEQETPKQQERKGWVLKERLLGSLNPDIKSIDKANTKVNYFIGNDRSKWKSNVASYNEISLGEIYKGISLKLRAYGNNVEKIFTVNPGSRPEAIRLAVEGALSLAANKEGELEAETGLGTVRFRAPIAYQEKEGERTYVKVAYKIDKDAYGFNVGDYDRQIPLIIDPLLASTFIGGSGDDQGRAVALDSSGNVYIVNITTSSDYPTTTGAYDVTYHGSDDISISKLNADLSSLIASTFIGGSGDEWSYDIALDSSDNVYVAGNTKSNNYPTTAGAYDQTWAGGWDSMISKLNSDLDTLIASTFIGGSNDDSAFALVLDILNSKVYVAGKNYLGGYPVTVGACYDAIFNGSNDIVVSRLDFDLTALEASTYIGGTLQDIAIAIALDSSTPNPNVVVFGYSESINYPTIIPAWDETHNGGWDLVVSRLDANLVTLQASTYIGGPADDMAGGSLALDSSDNVYVTGHTGSAEYPTTTGAYDDTHNGSRDVVVSILNPALSSLQASTFIGGSGNDQGKTPAIDSSGNVYVVGYTASSDYPTTTGAYDRTHNGSNDIFISRLDSNLTTLQVSTFIGGGMGDDVSSGDFILDSSGNVYVTGTTGSTDFPTTTGAYDTTHNGSNDVFVSKLTGDLLLSPGTYYVDISQVSEGDGSAADPWKTLHYALQEINNGPSGTYILNVAAGTYSVANEEADATLVINQDNVTIQGAGAGSSIISGSGALTWQIGIEVNASNVTISGLEVSNFTINGINIYTGTGQIVEDCDIHDNNWGIYTNNTSPEIRKNKIYDNTKGIYITVFSGAYAPVIKNNLIYTPTGTMENGIEVYTFQSFSVASPSIYHNTIDGGTQYGIYIREDVEPITAEIKYNIITNFASGIRFSGTTPSMTIDYNDVYGNTTNYDGCSAGANDISPPQDPIYVGGGDYNLQSGSPCIDAIPTGDPVSDDIVGNPRPQGLGYDMGCYEYLTPTQYTLTVEIVGQGSVTLNPTGGTYNEGTVVTLTAVADSGWDFSAWSGDLTGSTNPDTTTMDSDKSVTATFTLNSPPDTPTTSSPADEAIFAEGTGTVPIDTSIFSDPDSGDTHTESHWLVKRADSVYYRLDYDTSFDTLATTGDLTQHTVSGLSSGMKYVWKVGYTDSGSGETSWSEEYDFKIGTSVADSSVEINSGTEEADFTMVSFVQWPDHSAASSVFDLAYDKKYFRIGTYDPTNGSGGYVEYGSSLKIEPGKAYWFLAKDGLPITVNGIPVSLFDDIDVGLLFNASNQNGWNMIGCPNAADYYWDYIEVIEYNPSDGSIVFPPTAITDLPDPNAYIDKRLWRWESGTYYPDATLMEKYKGYWVKAKKANVFLRFRPSARASLSNPPTYFARLLSNGKKWMKRWVFTPQVAIADSDDSPPRPMGDFSTVSPESVGGCFIATAVYGSPMERHVTILRAFRDTYLLSSTIGHMFVKAYYRYSPPVADFIAKHKALKAAVRMGLLPMVAFCYSALHFGLVVSACGLLLIFMPLIFLVLVYQRRRV